MANGDALSFVRRVRRSLVVDDDVSLEESVFVPGLRFELFEEC